MKHINLLNSEKYNQISKGIKQSHPESKNGNRNNKDVTKEHHPGHEDLGKRVGITNASITNKIKEIEERISNIEDTIENTDTAVKEKAKFKDFLTHNIHEIQDTMVRPNLITVGIEESEEDQQMSSTKLYNKSSLS